MIALKNLFTKLTLKSQITKINFIIKVKYTRVNYFRLKFRSLGKSELKD